MSNSKEQLDSKIVQCEADIKKLQENLDFLKQEKEELGKKDNWLIAISKEEDRVILNLNKLSKGLKKIISRDVPRENLSYISFSLDGKKKIIKFIRLHSMKGATKWATPCRFKNPLKKKEKSF